MYIVHCGPCIEYDIMALTSFYFQHFFTAVLYLEIKLFCVNKVNALFYFIIMTSAKETIRIDRSIEFSNSSRYGFLDKILIFCICFSFPLCHSDYILMPYFLAMLYFFISNYQVSPLCVAFSFFHF